MLIALFLGLAFRLVWPLDIEYKWDEAFSFERTRAFLEDGRVEWLGMPTSKGYQNPALSLWSFYGLGLITGAATPPDLARGVQWLNIGAILGLLIFGYCSFKGREREWWLWATALVCVSAFGVLMQRKIWPPSVLPAVMVGIIICWKNRSRPWGAFGWGCLGLLAAQVHMVVLFYLLALAGWAFFYDRKKTSWFWAAAGAAIGVLPLLPWVAYMATTSEHPNATAFSLKWALSAKFWILWGTEPFNIGLQWSLGKNLWDFLKWPRIFGYSSYGTFVLLIIAWGICLGLIGTHALSWYRDRSRWSERWSEGRAHFTTSLIQAGFWGYGILLSLSLMRLERQYLTVAFPITMLWVATMALPINATESAWRNGRRLLLVLVTNNALMTISFLSFIHVEGGAPKGDFGRSYARQKLENSIFPARAQDAIDSAPK